MRSFFLWIALLATVVGTACSDAYDDSELRKELEALADRVARLEQLCQQMNTNISSLQGLITALQQQDYITSVAPITQDGVTIGYVISFAKGEPITIYHGKDGTSSLIPVIGVKQDTDGIYYWTLNGEWLTNEKGEKVRAEGTDGVTPQLKIENGYWMVSYNGTDWTTLGKATGESGQTGHSCNIVAVSYDAEYVYITLADGTTLTLPRVVTGVLSIMHTNKSYIGILVLRAQIFRA